MNPGRTRPCDRHGVNSGIHLLVSGLVQGVGFRYFVRRAAQARGIAGWVRNRRDGRVEALVIGSGDALQAVLDAIDRGPRGARVDEVVKRAATPAECMAAGAEFEITTTA